MTSDGATSATPWARRWGRVLAGVSIISTLLAIMGGFVVVALALMVSRDFGGGEVELSSEVTYWVAALVFALVGVVGLVLTSRLPALAYLLRLVVVLPYLALGLISFWLMLPAAVVAAAHVSLALSHLGAGSNPRVRWTGAVATGVVFGWLVLPVVEDGCGRREDSCEFESLVGWGAHEAQQLPLWIGLILLVTLVVGLPVIRDEDDVLV